MRRFTVVVPALNEEVFIGGALASARRALGPEAELVVVDGGSRDMTRERARRAARVLHSPPGRGRQLRRGVEASTGDVLVFLHADSRLPPESGRAIGDALDSGAVAGCHAFAFADGRGGAVGRLLEGAVNLRSRIFRTATGDQAIFATREALERAGGIPDQPLFEDVELVRRLRRVGEFRVLDVPARTSARRWERRGYGRTILEHAGLRLAWWLGASPERLASWYRGGVRD
jgi:rSAM/selenodomain-associated transferase 2